MSDEAAINLNHSSMPAKIREAKDKEDAIRRDLASGIALDPHILLTDVYRNLHDFQFADLSPDEAQIPMLLTSFQKKHSPGTPSVVPEAEFQARWAKFTRGALDGVDWSNLFAAGGSVVSCLMPEGEEVADSADIDLFLYSLSQEQANAKLRHIYEQIRKNTGQTPGVVRTSQSVTILGTYPTRHVQVVLRMYKSPAEVLIGFDVDACTAGFDGTTVWALGRCVRALNQRFCVVDLTRRSLTYEVRLHKYAKRGFSVLVPGMEQPKIHESVTTAPPELVSGLGKLVSYHHRATTGQTRSAAQVVASRRLHRLGYGRVDKFTQDKWDEHRAVMSGPQADQDKSDYSEVYIPWGPQWVSFTILRLLEYRDKAQYFTNNPDTHRHIIVSGIDSVFDGLSCWCGMCRKRGSKDTHLIEPDDGAQVRGPLKWRTDNPMGQLLSGSFHPLPAGDWYERGYTPFSPPAGKVVSAVPTKSSGQRFAFNVPQGGGGFKFSPPQATGGKVQPGGFGGGSPNKGQFAPKFGGGSPGGGFGPQKATATGGLQFGGFGASPTGGGCGGFGGGQSGGGSFGGGQSGGFGVSPKTGGGFGASPTGGGCGGFGGGQSGGGFSFPSPPKQMPAPPMQTPPSDSQAWAAHRPATFAELCHLFTGQQQGADIPTNDVAKALLLISTLHKGSKLSDEQRRQLKWIVLKRGDHMGAITAAIQSFLVDRDFEDLAASFIIICSMAEKGDAPASSQGEGGTWWG